MTGKAFQSRFIRVIYRIIMIEHNVYIPELIFGHLLTSSNYDDSIKKVTGGRNGYGAKLTNIFSKKFTLET
jgi:DNA topoisomerase-2